MPEDHEQPAVINMLTNLSRDTSQIKTDLAVNTTKTSFIEEHLRTLNGKVLKQEEHQQLADKERLNLTTRLDSIALSKRRWDEGLIGALKEFALFALGLLSAYIIKKYF